MDPGHLRQQGVVRHVVPGGQAGAVLLGRHDRLTSATVLDDHLDEPRVGAVSQTRDPAQLGRGELTDLVGE
ncbi:hypothetical protein HUT08_14355 [Streptomyces buecherae]|uniref:Uncharacterized protein n=1 Tax=Streptomyces buecherae TaxID=2763006 RepID=A0A7H8N857_9ACTN|nr:hypothetical protein HUT08_14355 [Streptomyces buecherae]